VQTRPESAAMVRQSLAEAVAAFIVVMPPWLAARAADLYGAEAGQTSAPCAALHRTVGLEGFWDEGGAKVSLLQTEDREQGATIAGMSCTVTVSRRWFPKRKLGWRKLELTSGASPGKETSDGSERFRVRSARQLSSARRCVREGVLSCVKGSSTSVS